MPHQLESWYPRRCRRRGRFRVTPWRLGLDRLLAPQGPPFSRSVSAAYIASRPYEPLPTVSSQSANSTVLTGLTKVVSGPVHC